MIVRIMRGLPGSGKSFFGSVILSKLYKIIESRIAICSADHFFIGDDGVYRFDVKKLAKAHEQCRRKFLEAVQSGEYDLIVVDNTNTMPTEIAFYYDLATLYTGDVEIHRIAPPATMDIKDWLAQCEKMNQHNVPMKSIQSMSDRMTKHKKPWFWKEKMVTREDGHFVLNGKEHQVNEKECPID